MKKIFYVALLLVLSSKPALAFTECLIDIKMIYAGDGGMIYIFSQSGISFNITPDDPNLKNALTLATSALMGGNQLYVRYKTTGVDCTKDRSNDFGGLTIVKK